MAAADFDAWLNDYQAHEVEVSVCSAGGLFAEHEAAEQALAAAQGHEDAVAAAELVRELEAKIAASTRVFRLRSVGALTWADLLAEHPPTDEQLKQDPGADHDPATFPPAALAASSVEPMTVDQATQLRKKLQPAQWLKVWGAVLQANLGVLDPPKSMLAGVVLRRNGGSGTTPASVGSPDPSS